MLFLLLLNYAVSCYLTFFHRRENMPNCAFLTMKLLPQEALDINPPPTHTHPMEHILCVMSYFKLFVFVLLYIC